MPAISAYAPGKIILFGEHAVVYGRPAIAVPVTQVQARALVTANPRGASGSLWIEAPEINLAADLKTLSAQHPLALAIAGVLDALGIAQPPALNLRITSTIPLASGLGSGAAVSVAVIRALSAFLGHPLADEKVSALAYQIERVYHGTPSGIDNTVITFSRPVFFIREQPIQFLEVAQPFTLVVADTGVPSPTAGVVGDVRAHWQARPEAYNRLFDAIGEIAWKARAAITGGDIHALGSLMDHNHAFLKEMGVSSPELDRLAETARSNGAWGAKLSGGGRGGNLIALSPAEAAPGLAEALRRAGAARAILTQVCNPGRSPSL